MKQKNYYQLNSIILPIIMLIILGVGLFAATRLTGLRQILKSRATLEKASIGLGASKTASIGQEFEIPVMLSLKNQEIVAADVVLSFDKNALALTDITPKPESSGNKLTTYIPRDSNGFNKNKILQTANSTGKIEFGAVCFSAAGCPQGQNQDLKESNPLAILKFKTLKTGNTALNVLYSPGVTNNSNLITRTKEQIISNSTPLSITVASNAPVTTTPPTVSIPTTTLTLSKSSGFVNGETITLNFNSSGGSGSTTIHTSIWQGVSDPTKKTGGGSYQSLSGTGGQRTATVPFYVEYLAIDNKGNKETTKNMSVVAASTPTPLSAPALQGSCTTGSTTPTLSWNSIAGAVSYDVRVDNRQGTSSFSRKDCNPHSVCVNYWPNTSLSFQGSAGGQYQAWVHAVDSVNKEGPASNLVRFGCGVSTPAPTLVPTPTPTPTPVPTLVPVSISITNPSFENWSSGAGSGTTDRKAPDGWIMLPNDGYSKRETNARSNSYSWMRIAYGNGGGYMGGYQDVTVSPNTNYIISGWVLAPGALNWYRSEAGGNIDVRNRICARTTSNQDIKCFDSTEASGTWQKLEISFNSGSNTTIRIYFGTNINQTTFWDDFSIQAQ